MRGTGMSSMALFMVYIVCCMSYPVLLSVLLPLSVIPFSSLFDIYLILFLQFLASPLHSIALLIRCAMLIDHAVLYYVIRLEFQ